MPEVFLAKHVERKLVGAATFPQKIGVHPGCHPLRRLAKRGERRLVETQQHGGRFDLAAFAVRCFDLQRRVVVGEYGADFERAFFFVKDIHAGEREDAARNADLSEARIIA